LQPTNDADLSAEKRKAHYAASETEQTPLQPSDDEDDSAAKRNGSGCNYDPTDPLPEDTYSSVWERQVDVACQTVEFVVTNLILDLKNNLEPKGYRTEKKQVESIHTAVSIWSQLKDYCSQLSSDGADASAEKRKAEYAGADDAIENSGSERALFLFGVDSAIELASNAIDRLGRPGCKACSPVVVAELSAGARQVAEVWPKVAIELMKIDGRGADAEAEAVG
jgi:hypothetical protein